jgi:uncharacterized protein (TIGR01244 family)
MADPRFLTDTFAVAPQIAVEDLADLKAQGFQRILCNRPDGEVPPEYGSAAMQSACEALGLDFVLNPLTHGELSSRHIDLQREAAAQPGKTLAYCASGNRSSILWSLAVAGKVPTDEIIDRTTAAGYSLQGLVPQIEAMAAASGR